MSWQDKRTMSPAEFKRSIARLGLSEDAAARYLDISDSTARRFASGHTTVWTSVALLLAGMIERNEWPRNVPPYVPRKKPRKSAQLDAHPD